MARTWLVWSSLCSVFVLYTLVLEVYGSKDAYLYKTDFEPHRTSDSQVSLKLLGYSHLNKRHINQEKSPPQQQLINDDSYQSPLITSPLPIVKDTKTNNISNTTPLSELINSKVPEKVLDKNLEEGDGARPVDPAVSNKTLEKENITEVKNDTHIYYDSTFIGDSATGNHFWVDMDNNKSNVTINSVLSKSHRRAATVKLSFDFPFYGHSVRNVTIATGGFLYMGEYVHSWLAATQYIAPLMANFDTSLSNDSSVKYVDNGTAFTVQWEKVYLQEKPGNGEFTFQATLQRNGDIIFVYKTIPLRIQDIQDDRHPIKVGLSDAYIFDRQINYLGRKTIYEYHRMNFAKEDIKNSTAIYLKALPTCLVNKDCHTCFTNEIPNLQCAWCPLANRCSDGIDIYRQDWLMKGCNIKHLTNESQCPQPNIYDGYDSTGVDPSHSISTTEVIHTIEGRTLTNDIYLYNTDTEPYRTSDSRLPLEFSHHLDKRQTNQEKSPPPPPQQQQQQPINDNRSYQSPSLITTPSPIIKDSKTNINNKTPLSEPSNSTMPKKVLGKNLGENGAGQRKNYTYTTIRPNITKGVQPILHNDDLIVAKNQTEIDEDEISISKFADADDPAVFNKTLEKENITEVKNDTHIYYNSTFIVDSATGNHFWIDMNNNKSNVTINGLLSKSHRRAATVKLSFDFPFYGHSVRNVTIATGGFLYMGDYVHSWLAATQYIAPLMANFDTSLSNDSFIKYVDNGTAFTVQWEKVSLQEKPEDGEFTFQATLLNNGDIIFVYKTIPLIIEDIQDDHHPVKVGLSDAYIIDRTMFYVRRKTIYEYHRVNFNKEDIKNSTVVYLKALPTCLVNKDCHTCLTKEIANFQCTWCPSTNRCSNGLDRHRQDWLMKGCDRKQLINESQCSQPNVYDGYDHDGHEFYYGSNKNYDGTDRSHSINGTTQVNHTLENRSGILTNGNDRPRNVDNPLDDSSKQTNTFSDTMQASRISHNSRVLDPDGEVRMGASGIITILFMVAVVAGLSVWVLYAYRNPHTTSGQILIRYRPSQWRWRRGEARYTAATIHM